MNLETARRKRRQAFEVTKRIPPGSAYAVYDVECLLCEWRSSGWDWRRNALDAGFAHVAKEHS